RVFGHKKAKELSDEDLSIRLLELETKGLVLEIPANSCSKGHRLRLELKTKSGSKEVPFEALAQVETWERMENGKERISVRFLKYDQEVWDELTRLFSRRQDDILEFFRAVKGE
ncbi:MAG TPA: hypothetical protein VL588_05675, partial [Bdellovibrionota bacterium]|nr:hypothetical protein [Bdellovibrionota bacterium]